jgi:hypothetical protein
VQNFIVLAVYLSMDLRFVEATWKKPTHLRRRMLNIAGEDPDDWLDVCIFSRYLSSPLANLWILRQLFLFK